MDFRRRQLTIWLASRNNPYFARAAANRVWSDLFGRGLVEPVDSMDLDNPASHPEVLQFLSDLLIESRFDLRLLYETLAKTKAYGLTSRFVDLDRPGPDSFAVMNVKTLSPSQYFDSLRQNVLASAPDSPDPTGASVDFMRREFLTRMSARGTSTLDYPHGVVQALGMMNGPEMLNATSQSGSRLLRALDAPFLTDQQRIEAVFLACLSRYPSESELQRFQEHLAKSPEYGLTDIAWVLLNTAECFVCP